MSNTEDEEENSATQSLVGDEDTSSTLSSITTPSTLLPPPATYDCKDILQSTDTIQEEQSSPPSSTSSNEDEHNNISGIDDALPPNRSSRLSPPQHRQEQAVLPCNRDKHVTSTTHGAHRINGIGSGNNNAYTINPTSGSSLTAVVTQDGDNAAVSERQGDSAIMRAALGDNDNNDNSIRRSTLTAYVTQQDTTEDIENNNLAVAELVPEDEQVYTHGVRVSDARRSSFQAVLLDSVPIDPTIVREFNEDELNKMSKALKQRLAFTACVLCGLIALGFGLGFGLSRGSDEVKVQAIYTDSTSNITDTYGLYKPPMPLKVSQELSIARDGILKGIFLPIHFSGNCSIAALSRIHTTAFHANEIEWAQTVQYDTMSDEWTLLNEEVVNDTDERGNRFGSALALSNDGLIMAVGIPRSDYENITNTGSVRVYSRKQMNNKWTPLGSDLHGMEANEWMGTIVSLSSDGTMVAISSPLAYATRGCIRVYRFDEALNEWTQVGIDILGDGITSYLTYVDLSADGNVLAIGAQFDDTTAKNAGSLKVFRFSEDVWIQFGQSIYGDRAEGQFGTNVQLSRDGFTVAFSGFEEGSELARVYSYHPDKDEWIQKGNFAKVACVKLSDDGERVIMCSLEECFVYSFIDENDWKEEVTFDPIGFAPLDFTDDGKTVCGVTSTGPETTTISYYQLK